MADRDRPSLTDDREKDDIQRMAITVAILFDLFESSEDQQDVATDHPESSSEGTR
jgi:hypothetical protein